VIKALVIFIFSIFGANLLAAELNVYAAASLTDVMNEIAVAYEKESGDKLQFNFGASSLLERQIEEGAPVDVFLSADEAKMDLLEKKNLLLAGTRRVLLSNLLVIVVPNETKVAPASAADLTRPACQKLALADPQSVPAGIYAREYLQKHGLWDVLKDRIVSTENVRGALAAVEGGNVDAGIVYKTDALISKKVKVAVEIPAAEGPKISYPVAVTKSSSQPERAKKFVEYLRTPAARTLFEKLGFIVAE
jgi:molybdate transport system substrate-binding protein